MRPLAAAARRALRADKAAWILQRSATIAADLRQGSTRSMWLLARQLANRKCKGPRTLAVVTDEAGKPLASEVAVAQRWQQVFFKEFSERGEQLEESALHDRLEQLRASWR